jgi:hypothetical protein
MFRFGSIWTAAWKGLEAASAGRGRRPANILVRTRPPGAGERAVADKKKAYRRFEELTKRAMAPASKAEQDRTPTDQDPGGDGGALESPGEALLVSLSPEVCRALELRADADHTTPSAIVEAALRRYLEIRRSRFT